MIVFACLVCGFMGTLGYLSALIVGPFMVFFCALGGFFDVMDVTGWTMLIGPPVSAFVGATGAKLWRRSHPPEPDFVAPPPPPGWRARRKQRSSKRTNDRFEL